MCCSDGIQQRPPPTEAPVTNNPCSSPDGYSGYCIGMT